MTKNQKLLLGLAAAGVAIYLYKKNQEKKSQNTIEEVAGEGSEMSNAIGIGSVGMKKIRKERGEFCVCADGRKYQCLRPNCCATYCSRFGGLDKTTTRV